MAYIEEHSIPVPECGCWLWLGPVMGTGKYQYGCIAGTTIYAHRKSYELYKGKIPVGSVVRHTCDTPLCVNPEHLICGTQADNLQDAFARGRLNNQGEQHGNAKLTEENIFEILHLLKTTTLSQRVIGERFSVGQDQISRIKNGKRWGYV